MAPRKYAFDTVFAPDGAIVREARLSPDQVKAQADAAYARGKDDALAQAERRAAAALEALALAASETLARLDGESRAMRKEAANIALLAARKIAGAALDAFGAARAAAAVEAAMDALRHQPRLVVTLAADAADALRPRLAEMCERHAYAGAILVRAEPGAPAGAVSIDWSDGVVSMNPEDAAERIEALVQAALTQPETRTT